MKQDEEHHYSIAQTKNPNKQGQHRYNLRAGQNTRFGHIDNQIPNNRHEARSLISSDSIFTTITMIRNQAPGQKNNRKRWTN